jgi:HD-GYP domain-containing protein (c-di-GMP phosphodiesterase class II)
MVHCLNGDPQSAPISGCAMIKNLVSLKGKQFKRGNSGNTGPQEVPAVCGQGYAVSLYPAKNDGDPAILILHPAYPSQTSEEIIPPALESLCSALLEICKLNHENNDLADEVLRNYEQINLIFDISAQIATLSDGDEVRRTLLSKIRQLFDADAVFLLSADERTIIMVTDKSGFMHQRGAKVRVFDIDSPELHPSDWDDTKGKGSGYSIESIQLPPEFDRAKQQLRKSLRVFVSTTDPSFERRGHGTSLWGPLQEGGDEFAFVGVIRRKSPFASGDMLLLDSILTFGGHILSNLQLVDRVKRSSIEAVRALVNAIDQKDNYTSGHAERVGLLAKATGQYMNLTPTELQTLEWAGLLHDVGKIGIPEQLLNKPGRLTDEEFALIKGHPSRGYEVLKPVASLEPILEAVLHHHESPDGSGYPDGLKGDQIPLLARIIHVVDVFDALTSTRSYRDAYDYERAIKILKEDAGTKLDSEIVGNFLDMWSRLPTTHPEQYERWFGVAKESGP